MSDLDVFKRMLLKMHSTVAGLPRMRWGTVVQSSPPRITRSGGNGMVTFKADTTNVGYLVPGERVRYEMQGNRATILGVAGRSRGMPEGTSVQMGMVSPPDGARFWNTTENREYVRTGGQWRVWDTGWVSITPEAPWIQEEPFQYRRQGNVVSIVGRLSRGAIGGANISWLPSDVRPIGTEVFHLDRGTIGKASRVVVFNFGQIAQSASTATSVDDLLTFSGVNFMTDW